MTQGCISKSGFSHEVYSGCLVGLHPYAIFIFLIIKPVYSTEEQYGNRNKAGPSPKEWAQQWHCQHLWLGEQEALQLCHSSVRPNSLFPSGCAFQTSVVFDLPIICRLNSKQLKCLHVLLLPALDLQCITRENIFYNTQAEGLAVTTVSLLASLNTVIKVFWTVACSYWILFCLKIDTSLLPPSAMSSLVTLRFWWSSPVAFAESSERSPAGSWFFDPSATRLFCETESKGHKTFAGKVWKRRDCLCLHVHF